MQNRVFFPQAAFDQWVVGGAIELAGIFRFVCVLFRRQHGWLRGGAAGKGCMQGRRKNQGLARSGTFGFIVTGSTYISASHFEEARAGERGRKKEKKTKERCRLSGPLLESLPEKNERLGALFESAGPWMFRLLFVSQCRALMRPAVFWNTSATSSSSASSGMPVT